MYFNFFSYNGNKNAINKELSNPLHIEGHLIEPCDIKNPLIIVKYSDEILTKNYVSSNLGVERFYFIEKIVIEGDTVKLYLHEDVLQTYRADIQNACGYMLRSSQGNYYLPDEMIKKNTKTEWQFRKLGAGLGSGNKYVLIVGGVD